MAKKETIEMQGPGGRCVVAKSDKSRYEQRGYTVIGADEATTNNESVDLSSLSMAELRRMAADRGIAYPSGSKKADLIQLLQDEDNQ